MKAVFGRDGYTCQACETKKSPFNAHHIKNYATCIEGRYDASNGITLCELCHERFHQLFGQEQNDRAQLDEFIDFKRRNVL